MRGEVRRKSGRVQGASPVTNLPLDPQEKEY